MAYVLCLKNMRVISRTGISMALESKMEPQRVPDALLPELISSGCVQCDEHGNILVHGIPLAVRRLGDAAPADEPQPTFDREAAIDAAVKSLIEGADPKNLNKVNGFPKVFAVRVIVGFQVSKDEVEASVRRLGY